MSYMVFWEQVLMPIYDIKKWEADASLEKHKRKKQEKHKKGSHAVFHSRTPIDIGLAPRNPQLLRLAFPPYFFTFDLIVFCLFFRLWARAVHK